MSTNYYYRTIYCGSQFSNDSCPKVYGGLYHSAVYTNQNVEAFSVRVCLLFFLRNDTCHLGICPTYRPGPSS